MKSLILILSLVFLSACGGSGGSSSVNSQMCSNEPSVGKWRNGPFTMFLEANCTGRVDVCASQFNYTTDGSYITLNVTDTAPIEGCLPIGTYTCDTFLTENQLHINCNGAITVFERE